MLGFFAKDTVALSIGAADAIAVMLEVRAEWVVYRGEPRTPADIDEIGRLTRLRIQNPSAPLGLTYREPTAPMPAMVPVKYHPMKLCKGCRRPLPLRRWDYCDDPYCIKLKNKANRRRCYENKMNTTDGRARHREEAKRAMQALRDRRRAAGLTGEGKVRK